MVDDRPCHPVLASHRARSFAVASHYSKLLVWLSDARQFPANRVAAVSRRDTPLLQRSRVCSDDHRHVLPHVSASGRTERRV